MRINKYLLCVVITLSACLAYTAQGDNRHKRGSQRHHTTAVQPLKGSTANAASPTDFSTVGTVAPIKGMKEQLLKRTSYIVSYNANTRCPNWVAWRLTGSHTTGDVNRMGNAFHENDVPTPRATLTDYRKSGYSRGHLCPAGDNKWLQEAMYQTFLLTNVCPQNANLNSGVWNQIEMACRRWAEKYGEVYIITGPMFFRSSQPKFIGDNHVAVPDAFFKIILCLNDKPKAIGFICRNNDGNRKKDNYVNTLAQVERLTGLQFFPNLSPTIRAQIEHHADLNDW